MRRKARVDSNHAAIVGALRACGWYVHDTSRLGNGWVDLVIAKHGRLRLVEIKDGAKVPSKQKLTPDEAEVHAEFAKAGVHVLVISDLSQVITLEAIQDVQEGWRG